jgi:hypothetical protein
MQGLSRVMESINYEGLTIYSIFSFPIDSENIDTSFHRSVGGKILERFRQGLDLNRLKFCPCTFLGSDRRRARRFTPEDVDLSPNVSLMTK